MQLFKSLSWPQAAVALGLIAGGVVVSLYAPEDVRTAVIGLLLAVTSWLRVRQ